MARIKAIDESQTFWYQERGGPNTNYVWTEDQSQATDMPRKYAEHRADELTRYERFRDKDGGQPRDIKVVRSKP